MSCCLLSSTSWKGSMENHSRPVLELFTYWQFWAVVAYGIAEVWALVAVAALGRKHRLEAEKRKRAKNKHHGAK